MKTSAVSLALAAVITASSSLAFAQGATGGVGTPPPPAANWGKRFTPGWAQMTKEERKALGSKLRKVNTYNDCKAAIDEAAQKVADRTKSPPMTPKLDGCAALPK